VSDKARPVSWSTTQVEGARTALVKFEQRARELDGDQAPTGLDAIQARYFPPEAGHPPGDAYFESLRRTVKRLIGDEL